MNSTSQKFGPLNCRVEDDLPEGTSPELAVMICHGFGAPGSDLVPLAAEILRETPALRSSVRFYFPEAPLSMDQYGMWGARAWWMLDMVKLNAAIQKGEVRNMSQELPPGLVPAREKLQQLVEAVQAETGLDSSRIVLGGFSQGAMVTTDLVLHWDKTPAGLIALSGTLLCRSIWSDLAEKKTEKFPILMSHGDRDPILPYFLAEEYRDMLTAAGFPVEFVSFQGEHTISWNMLQKIGTFLQKLL